MNVTAPITTMLENIPTALELSHLARPVLVILYDKIVLTHSPSTPTRPGQLNRHYQPVLEYERPLGPTATAHSGRHCCCYHHNRYRCWDWYAGPNHGSSSLLQTDRHRLLLLLQLPLTSYRDLPDR